MDSSPHATGSSFLSPYGLASISTAIFLIAWLTPPQFYSSVMDEKDLIFLDPASMLYFLLCVAAFLAGAAAVDVFVPTDFLKLRTVNLRHWPLIFLLLPLVAGTLLTWAAIDLLLKDNPAILYLVVSQQGAQLKESLDIHQSLGLASIWLLGVCWWASWRRDQIAFDRVWKRRLATSIIAVALISIIAYSALKLARGEVMPVVVGTVLIYLIRRRSRGLLSRRTLFRVAAVGVPLLVALFLTFSILRGSSVELDDLQHALVSYTTASYNRLAAMVAGRLHYPYAGRGVYFSSFLSFNTSFNRLIPIREVFHWPTFDDMWTSEFTAVWQARLYGFSIWSGAFGELFADFGWFAPLVVFLHGLLCGWLWRSVRRGRLFGIILYPWAGFCVLFWFGTNFLLDTKIVVLAIASVTLIIYEGLWGVSFSPVAERGPSN